MNDDRILDNLRSVQERVTNAARRAGRDPASVTLVAVTKKRPPEFLTPLVGAGVCDLGENYPQELWEKADAFVESPTPIRWHLIGHLQGNKAKRTFPLVRMIHGVDSRKLLHVLDGLAVDHPDPPTVCLQVNTSDEQAKHGWSETEILADAEAIASCNRLSIVGLMTMAAWGTDAETARSSFIRLRNVRDALEARSGLRLPELSMGMSNDFETAIEEGATLVRVGSALFEGVDS